MKKIFQIEPSLGEEEKKELIKIIDSGWFTEGTKTRDFEKVFAKFVGSKYSCVVTSGTAALFLALKALGIGKGDEVIVPDLTFVASPNSVEMAGAKPIFVDIEPESLNLDLSKVRKKITKKTKAIMPVDFNGRSTNFKELREIASKNNLLLIEDACHAIGSYFNEKHMGTLSDVGIFSFSIPKIITTGQGGMVVTNNKKIYEKCTALKDFGRKLGIKKDVRKTFDHQIIGYNFKFTEFQAAVGLAQMRKLSIRLKRKKIMMKRYNESLQGINSIEFINTDLEKISPWMIDILLKSKNLRDRLINHLQKKGIETRIFYPAIHRLRPYRKPDNLFKISSEKCDVGLWLPSSITLSNKKIDRICTEIKKFFS